MKQIDVTVIGGGPGGLAAAIATKKAGSEVLLIEREARLGGILKQCIHDGFGLMRFHEKLSGPEYVERFIAEFHSLGIPSEILTFVTKIERKEKLFEITYVNQKGVSSVCSKTIVLATGCRERTAKQVFIHGTRPAGVFTAGTAQHMVNLQGIMPAQKCVILGSGDIGLIMARRLTLEGAEVLGVYEAKSTPSGLTRNLVQCLDDFGIPLHLSTSVTRVFGADRLEAVEISKVDEQMHPIPGTEERIDCDALILSVGLIPENEIAESIGTEMDRRTKGPSVDETLMTNVPGVFVCGNALHVNDLVDYVSESGETAGSAAAAYDGSEHACIRMDADQSLLYLVPQRILKADPQNQPITIYFRTSKPMEKARFVIMDGNKEVFSRAFSHLRPPEMQRLILPGNLDGLRQSSTLNVMLQEVAE